MVKECGRTQAKQLAEKLAACIFGTDDYDLWDGVGVAVGMFPARYKKDNQVRFVRAADLRTSPVTRKLYGEMYFENDVIKSMIAGEDRKAVGAAVVGMLFDRFAIDLGEGSYLEELGLNPDKTPVIVGRVDVLLQARNAGVLLSMRVKVATVDLG
jgi:hypothetical protein